jgi:hypothetical protein
LPFTRTPGETMTYLLGAATKVADATTKTYVAGLNALVEQQKVAQQASLEWLSAVTGVQSDVHDQLVESYDSVKGELTEPSRAAAVSATSKRRTAPARPARRKTPTTAKSAARSTPQPGPARWTGEAYESLTAAEVNQKLPQFSQRELREVETYEKAHQSRQTVLDKIGALHGQQPVPDYDELNVQEIEKLLAEGDDQLATRVRDYERPRKSRDGVLQPVDAKLAKS